VEASGQSSTNTHAYPMSQGRQLLQVNVLARRRRAAATRKYDTASLRLPVPGPWADESRAESC
jgi:hypothetical protein